MGVGICYDMRFAELAQLYGRKGVCAEMSYLTSVMLFLVAGKINNLVLLWSSGCQLLVYPGAFNMTTGPAHWELLQRGRSGSVTMAI